MYVLNHHPPKNGGSALDIRRVAQSQQRGRGIEAPCWAAEVATEQPIKYEAKNWLHNIM